MGTACEKSEGKGRTSATNVRKTSTSKHNSTNTNNSGADSPNPCETDNTSTETIENWLPKLKYKRHLNKLKKQNISAVFNYSSLTLTDSMWEVLNMGLKFAILPLKLDITQVLVDFRKYERNLVWREFFFKMEDNEEEYKPPIFKTDKTNFPKNYKSPEGLKTFIGATKSEILDPRNRNNVKCNISKDKILAIKGW